MRRIVKVAVAAAAVLGLALAASAPPMFHHGHQPRVVADGDMFHHG